MFFTKRLTRLRVRLTKFNAPAYQGGSRLDVSLQLHWRESTTWHTKTNLQWFQTTLFFTIRNATLVLRLIPWDGLEGGAGDDKLLGRFTNDQSISDRFEHIKRGEPRPKLPSAKNVFQRTSDPKLEKAFLFTDTWTRVTKTISHLGMFGICQALRRCSLICH